MSVQGKADDVLYALQGLALARHLLVPETLTGLDVFAPFLDDIRQDGALFLLSFLPIPNANNEPPYVASLSRGRVWDGGEPIRVGDEVMENAVARCILEYARRCWQFEW